MNVAAWLERNGRSFPERPAIARGASLHADFRTWAARAGAIAGALLDALGCHPGECAAIIMRNQPEYLEAKFGIWHAGLCAVPVNARLHQSEFEYILADSRSRLAFVSPDLAETILPLIDRVSSLERVVIAPGPEWDAFLRHAPHALVSRAPADPAWLFYTSGTTGRPKGATLTHRNLAAMTLSYFADIDFVAPEDCILHAAPLSHGSGLYGLPFVAKAGLSVLPESGHFDGDEIAHLLHRWHGMSFFAAPTMVMRLVAAPAFAAADLRNLKTIIYGGAPMYVEDLKRALDVVGPKLHQIYGQGESPMTITGVSKAMHAEREHPRWEARLGSAGVARTGVEVRVADDADRELPPGEVGEILVRGDVVMAGYWNNPEATRETLRGGWLHTGDVGAFDADGFLTLKDRSKDLIISGGANIYPREVEEVLLRHPGIAEVSVVGRPDREWGERVVAFVVRRPDASVDESELDRLCLDSIARFKRPKVYVFLDELPKNNYGKVLKTELRKRWSTK